MDRFVFKNERIMLMIINDIKNTEFVPTYTFSSVFDLGEIMK